MRNRRLARSATRRRGEDRQYRTVRRPPMEVAQDRRSVVCMPARKCENCASAEDVQLVGNRTASRWLCHRCVAVFLGGGPPSADDWVVPEMGTRACPRCGAPEGLVIPKRLSEGSVFDVQSHGVGDGGAAICLACRATVVYGKPVSSN